MKALIKGLAARVLDYLASEPVVASAVAAAGAYGLRYGWSTNQIWLIVGAFIPRQFVTPANNR